MENKVIKIMQEPKHTPCHYCEKDYCIGEEYLECDKLKDYNRKIIAKEYDRQEAIEKMAKAHFNCAFRKTGTKWEDLTSIVKGKYYKYAEAALNALLEGGKNETD